ncbi:MAG: DUF2723 domain-containing protein [Chloroflexi bacterium]|uniref:DUF2723 domain-containing protein n=1 Tax=Candidatus Chlorohelix allophototropha TaxID=3003348 RepID=A0A8T7M5J7_9CHLR|nr:DUF2723 domain-containing protein [Chloroflexota bacterium]WJW69180.1 DUF2723 domain-containing protein [Chloroflexota bacterium L227-S17]
MGITATNKTTQAPHRLALNPQQTQISRILVKTLPLILLGLLGLVFRLLTTPDFVESRDGIFFTRGLVRYSVYEMRPHWPGYPVYLWFGSLFHWFISDPTGALHLLSVVASVLTSLPLAKVAIEWKRATGANERDVQLAGITAAVVWLLVPLSWLGGSEIFSDPLALLLGATMFWLSWRALVRSEKAWQYLLPAAALGGLMLGVRLSYVTLLLPLFYATWKNRHQKVGRWNYPALMLVVVGGLLISTGLWLSWQIWLEGSRFFEATINHLNGHYSEWGGSITTDHNLLNRPVRMLETTLVYGFGGWWPGTPWLRILPTLALLFLSINGIKRLLQASNRHMVILAGLWGIPYLLWILLGNDVDLARYDLPLVALICILAAIGLPFGRLAAYGALVALAFVLGMVTVPLAWEHRESPPIGQRLVRYVNQNLNNTGTTIAINDQIPYLIFYLQEYAPSYSSIRIQNDSLDVQVEKLTLEGRKIYITALPDSLGEGWVPVARFCRGQYMESRGPLEVWFYLYDPSNQQEPSLRCY